MRFTGQGATLALLVFWSCVASAALQPDKNQRRIPSPCDDKHHLQVTLGIPADYIEEEGGFRYETFGERPRQVCGAFAVGTPYQLLSWLENGAVQAAVLSDFAIAVMKADDPERFALDYYVLPVKALPSLPNKERRLLLTNGAGEAIGEPYQELDQFFDALIAGQANRPKQTGKPGKTILLPSHLSPAVPYLIRYAVAWAERKELTTRDREAFYTALLQAIRFGAPAQPAITPAVRVDYQLVDQMFRLSPRLRESVGNELKTDPELDLGLLDHVVVRKRVLMASSELRQLVAASLAGDKKPDGKIEDVALFARTRLLEDALGPKLTEFRESNYRRVQFGTVAQRHFRFTIPELWTLLHGVDDEVQSLSPQPSRLALVLTGGGVKAAYQTRLIDRLYGTSLLVNPDGGPRNGNSQQVDFVIGTSGGALLGVFVAAMDQQFQQAAQKSESNSLTSILWKEPEPGIASYDVFPFLDMMRYASFIVALLVVWIVAVVMLAVFRAQYPQVTRIDHSEESFFGRRARAWKESWPWIALLVLAPITIIKVANVNRVEHVPTVTGLYYAWMALVAFYSDVRLLPLKNFEWRRAKINWETVALVVAGAALITFALWQPIETSGLVLVNLCCLGFVLLTHSLHRFFHAQREYFRPEPRANIFRAFGVLLGIVVLSYLGVAFAMWMDRTSLLETDGGFWKYFLVLAALATLAYMWFGRARSAQDAVTWPQRTLGYLFSEYRSRAMFGSERRFMRFMSLTVLAWVWWNMLAAPALYGNHNARAYLKGAFRDFNCVVRDPCPTPREPVEVTEDDDNVENGVPFPLAVPFVITATSLEKSQERYFLFMSGSDTQIDEKLTSEAWYNVVRDPRWVVVRQPVDKELQHAAFASGSPFPVFSAHDVRLRALQNKERLIDGGFAHNKPLEAALALGADKVLVINSSPLPTNGQHAPCTLFTLSLGELACNLPKLLPYLWERSQVEDLLSTRSMVVASIYPTAPGGTWPALTDFRRRAVQDLVASADQDLEARVGVIESWGAPDFDTTGWLGYDRDQIKTAIMEAGKY
jgi:predicted acylesterase/phospholipase RssA